MMRVIGFSLLLFYFAAFDATAVAAQELLTPKIAVLNIQRVERESLAGKSIVPQVDKLRSAYQKQVRKQEAELRKADQELGGQRAILSPEMYTKKRREFQVRAGQAQKDVQARKRRLEIAVRNATNKMRRSLLLVTQEIAQQRKINIVLPKSVVLLRDKRLDITSEALKRLNKKLPSVKVVVSEKK